jgi:hypothetical protein
MTGAVILFELSPPARFHARTRAHTCTSATLGTFRDHA